MRSLDIVLDDRAVAYARKTRFKPKFLFDPSGKLRECIERASVAMRIKPISVPR